MPSTRPQRVGRGRAAPPTAPLLALALLGLTIAPRSVSAAPSDLPPAIASPLERIDYRRDGREKSAVGEVTIEGERVRLRLFSDELASHYEIWLPLQDFLGAVPLPSEEAERVRAERETAVRIRDAERAADRARRAAEREAARRAKTASRRDAPPAGGGEAAPDAGSIPRPDGEPAPRTEGEIAALIERIATNRSAASVRAGELLAEIAERLPQARATRGTLRELAGRLEEAEIGLARAEVSLGHRRDALARIEADRAAGALRGDGLADQIADVGARLGRIADDVARAEAAIATLAKEFATVPRFEPELAVTDPEPERATRTSAATGATPAPATAPASGPSPIGAPPRAAVVPSAAPHRTEPAAPAPPADRSATATEPSAAVVGGSAGGTVEGSSPEPPEVPAETERGATERGGDAVPPFAIPIAIAGLALVAALALRRRRGARVAADERHGPEGPVRTRVAPLRSPAPPRPAARPAGSPTAPSRPAAHPAAASSAPSRSSPPIVPRSREDAAGGNDGTRSRPGTLPGADEVASRRGGSSRG